MRGGRSEGRSERRSHPYDDRGGRSSYGGRDGGRESFREHRDDRYSRDSPREQGGDNRIAGLDTLKAEWEKLAPFRSVLPECVKLLGREIARLEDDGGRRRY
jgi:hypothetical protein